jgi:hypothetical protein
MLVTTEVELSDTFLAMPGHVQRYAVSLLLVIRGQAACDAAVCCYSCHVQSAVRPCCAEYAGRVISKVLHHCQKAGVWKIRQGS